jgi:hypothetical protein
LVLVLVPACDLDLPKRPLSWLSRALKCGLALARKFALGLGHLGIEAARSEVATQSRRKEPRKKKGGVRGAGLFSLVKKRQEGTI